MKQFLFKNKLFIIHIQKKVTILLIFSSILFYPLALSAVFYLQKQTKPLKIQPKALKFKIAYEKVLGKGSHGTMVFEGVFEGRKVAIKRLLKEFYCDSVEIQIALLLGLDAHSNVLRYFAKDEDETFLYLALELCCCDLSEFVQSFAFKEKDEKKVEKNQNVDIKVKNMKVIAREILNGVEHLHSKNIVHRDLKPQNILISKSGSAKVADMGLSRKLSMDVNSFESNNFGTSGWQPVEVINLERQNSLLDVFSLGCVLFYIFSSGKHPFGDHAIERQTNILTNNPITLISYTKSRTTHSILNPTSFHLIDHMIHPQLPSRLPLKDALHHPFFWEPQTALNFLCAVSNRFEKEPLDSRFNRLLESSSHRVTGGNWRKKLNIEILTSSGSFRKYNFRSLRDLLRILRNKAFHYSELPEEFRSRLGDFPRGYYGYFERKFPRLLLYVYLIAAAFWNSESVFVGFFEGCSERYFEILRRECFQRRRIWYPVLDC